MIVQNNAIHVIILLGLVLISSCKKHEDDTENPKITINKPTSNDTITLSTQDVMIDFVASDNDEIHDIIVTVTDTTGNRFYYKKIHDDVESYSFTDNFNPKVIMQLNPMVLKIEVNDHSSNQESKTLNFFVKP